MGFSNNPITLQQNPLVFNEGGTVQTLPIYVVEYGGSSQLSETVPEGLTTYLPAASAGLIYRLHSMASLGLYGSNEVIALQIGSGYVAVITAAQPFALLGGMLTEGPIKVWNNDSASHDFTLNYDFVATPAIF